MRAIVQRHQASAAHGAQQLRQPQAEHLRIISADDGNGQRNGGIQICAGAAKGLRHQHAAEHAQRPSDGDHQPAGVLGIVLAQDHAGIDAAAQQHQHQRAHEFAKPH